MLLIKITGFIAVLILLGILILVHEAGHFFVAKRSGVRIERFSVGFGPRIWSIKKGDTEYTLSLIPLGGYVKMAGEEPGEKLTGADWEFASKPPGKRFNIAVAGPAVNYIFGFLFVSFLIFSFGLPRSTSEIGNVMEGYPAEKAGLMAGDAIVSINGTDILFWDDVLKAVGGSEGEEIDLRIMRDSEAMDFSLLPKMVELKDITGERIERSVIGIGQSDKVAYMKADGLIDSLKGGARETWKVTSMSYKILWRMLTGNVSVKAVSGPVAIVAIGIELFVKNPILFLFLGAYLSLALAIFNLLPFPILDGGHILFLAIEKLRGRPLGRKTQEIVQNAALVLLISFVLVVTWNDIWKLF